MSAHTIGSVRSKQGLPVVDGSTDHPTQIVRLAVTGTASYDAGGSALDVSAYGTYCYGGRLAGRTTVGSLALKIEALVPSNRAASGLKLQVADAAGEVVATTDLSGEVFLFDVEMGA